MLLRITTLIISLLFCQYALADYSLFYEDNQTDYHNWGVGYDTEELGTSQAFGWSAGISMDLPTVIDREYLTAYGHLRASLFPRAIVEPFATIGLDLAEAGLLLFSDGNISPQVDTQLTYGLRFNLGASAIDVYSKVTYLTGYTIVDGTYHAYGIALALHY